MPNESNNSPITVFWGDYSWLSNFHPCVVILDKRGLFGYPSVEHAYQAAKTLDIHERIKIQSAATPAQAKKLGRTVTLRPNWDNLKLGIMLMLLRDKFSDADLCQRLLATGERELVEGNWWGDVYWGVCRGVGTNHLGRLLMQVREEMGRSIDGNR